MLKKRFSAIETYLQFLPNCYHRNKDEQSIALKWRIGRLKFKELYLPALDDGDVSQEEMQTLKTVAKVLVAFVALSLVTGSLSEDFGAQIVGIPRFGLCLMTFGSVVLLHMLIWQFIVGDSAILGRDPKAFIDLSRSNSFYSGVTAFGYVALALYCLRLTGFASQTETSDLGHGDRLVYGLAFGLTLIGIGLAARLRLLFQNLQPIPE
jgi:hypothetical protein